MISGVPLPLHLLLKVAYTRHFAKAAARMWRWRSPQPTPEALAGSLLQLERMWSASYGLFVIFGG